MVEMAKQLSDVDLAYQILADKRSSVYFRDLISKVLEIKGRPVHSLAHAMAEVHTQINMDSRFLHMGKGMWGLTEWVPQRGAKTIDEAVATTPESNLRREKLLEEIQQDYRTAGADGEESD